MNQRELAATTRAYLFAQLAKTERMGLSARARALRQDSKRAGPASRRHGGFGVRGVVAGPVLRSDQWPAVPAADPRPADAVFRRRFSEAVNLARDRAAISDALARCGALPDHNARNLLASGEASGRSEEMLEHIVRQLDEVIDGQFNTIADWTPRVAYLLVLAFFLTAP